MAKFFYGTSIILMVLSGGCTVLVLLFGLTTPGFFELAIIAVFTGGFPFLFFWAIFSNARESLRKQTWKPGGGMGES